jgi:hypothetical protein
VKSVILIGPCDRDPMVLFAEGGSEGEMVKGGWIDIHQVNITPDQT